MKDLQPLTAELLRDMPEEEKRIVLIRYHSWLRDERLKERQVANLAKRRKDYLSDSTHIKERQKEYMKEPAMKARKKVYDKKYYQNHKVVMDAQRRKNRKKAKLANE